PDLFPRILFDLARWQLRLDAGASSDDDFQRMLRLASPLYMAEYVRAPVLLVHGAQDTLAPPEESVRMAERLQAFGDTTKLLVVPGGKRLFNFRQLPQATLAWEATLAWLDQYLRPTPRGADAPRSAAEWLAGSPLRGLGLCGRLQCLVKGNLFLARIHVVDVEGPIRHVEEQAGSRAAGLVDVMTGQGCVAAGDELERP